MSEIDWARKLFRNQREEEESNNSSLSQNSPDTTSVRTGVVTAVNDDGSVQVRLNGSNTIITVKSETPVKVGDSIKIIKQGQTWVVYAMKTYVNDTQKKIDALHTEIKTKGEEIQASVKKDVDKVQGDLDAFKQTHTMTDADITTSITSNNNTLNAKIEGVQTDLTENYSKKTEVSASIDGLRTEVSENYVNSSTLGTETSKLQSQITQNATAIATEVTDRKQAVSGAVSESKAYTDQQADSISSTVEKKVMNSVGETYATKSEVTQTASGLEVKITSAVDTANSAKTTATNANATANAAKTAASNAAKTATDYLKYSSAGLEVGNANLDANVLIAPTGVNIRNGETTCADFTSEGINFYRTDGSNLLSFIPHSGMATIQSTAGVSLCLDSKTSIQLNNMGTKNPPVLNNNTPFIITANGNIANNVTYLTGGICLYANTSGTNGSINLKLSTSRDVSNYRWMMIFYKDDGSPARCYSQIIPNPSAGSRFSLFRQVYGVDTYYTGVQMYTWTARGITLNANGAGWFSESNQCGGESRATLFITQVIGWR